MQMYFCTVSGNWHFGLVFMLSAIYLKSINKHTQWSPRIVQIYTVTPPTTLYPDMSNAQTPGISCRCLVAGEYQAGTGDRAAGIPLLLLCIWCFIVLDACSVVRDNEPIRRNVQWDHLEGPPHQKLCCWPHDYMTVPHGPTSLHSDIT